LGDLNTIDASTFDSAFDDCGDCGLTYPASAPARRIDWIVQRGLVCGSCAKASITSSDHLPVVTTFFYPETKPLIVGPMERNGERGRRRGNVGQGAERRQTDLTRSIVAT
jgi:hypothetical protein